MNMNRRSFLAVMATATLAGSACSNEITRQRFYALGTEAQITLVGNRKLAEAALLACRKEIIAIESAFSLYDPNSMLSHLNSDGYVLTDERFSTLLRHALHMAGATSGAFDPTIQSLWQAYANGGDVERARRRIDWRGLVVEEKTVRFAQPGMAVSFNGIAQGFAADRVSDILKEYEFHNTLVDLGEFSARGTKQAGPWLLGIRDPLSKEIVARLEPKGAIATSEPQATVIAGRSHIFDPLERSGERWASVTVEAAEAWRADALSTAIAASPIAQASDLVTAGNATRAWLIHASGKLLVI